MYENTPTYEMPTYTRGGTMPEIEIGKEAPEHTKQIISQMQLGMSYGELLARLVHAVNHEYCKIIGETHQVPWDELEEKERTKFEEVFAHLLTHEKYDNIRSPEGTHNNWLEDKLKNGWQYGTSVSKEERCSTYVLPYNALTAEKKFKSVFVSHLIDALESFTLAKHTRLSKPIGDDAGFRR